MKRTIDVKLMIFLFFFALSQKLRNYITDII
jgi:hypothetical protein